MLLMIFTLSQNCFSTLYVSIDFKEIGICRIISPFAWRWFGVRFYNFFRTIATHFQLNSSSIELYYSAYKFNETNFNGFITNAAAPQSYLSLINKKKYLPIAITFNSTILVDWWAFFNANHIENKRIEYLFEICTQLDYAINLDKVYTTAFKNANSND